MTVQIFNKSAIIFYSSNSLEEKDFCKMLSMTQLQELMLKTIKKQRNKNKVSIVITKIRGYHKNLHDLYLTYMFIIAVAPH